MIYLDNAATTSVDDDVIKEMLPYFTMEYANPSEIYSYATGARKGMNTARKHIADLINADMTEVYFTSGGTESDNWAVKGAAYTLKNKGKHIITSAIEHHAVINSCRELEKSGYDITYIPVGRDGIVDPERIRRAIRNDTILVSIMMANNEIGTIQPVSEIGNIAHERGIWFHTDAVQAFGNIDIDVRKLNIDMLSASAHKCHGPKGMGILYVRNGIRLSSIMAGGKQERAMRAGTENIPGIVGFGKAAQICMAKDNYNSEYITKLRNHFIKRVTDEIDHVIVNGSVDKRLPGNVSFSFACLDGEAIQIQLDLKGICCSTGSACNAGSSGMSHVIAALNVPKEYSYGTLRFTISDRNTLEEIDYTVEALKEIVIKLRKMSAQYRAYVAQIPQFDRNMQ